SLDEGPIAQPGGGMQGVLRIVDRIARGTISVLLLGETGVGKEVIAERIHRSSPRAAKPLVRVNCAALAEPLVATDRFGDERGACTGADREKPGLLEAAEGGTVFLDEVGELPLALQAKLLRAVEEGVVRRVGGIASRSIDVRFVAATNRNLDDDVAAG